MLLMEFHGSEASVAEQAATVQEIAREHGGEGFQWATTPGGAQEALGGAPPRLLRRPADEAGLPHRHDRHLRADLAPGRVGDQGVGGGDAAGMQHYIVGHVGDGNFHIAYLVDPTKPEERELAEQLNEKRGACARSRIEGTCSGEHGVGLHKMELPDRARPAPTRST